MNNKTVYLTGKVTGDPNCIEKFKYAEIYLKSEGYTVLHRALLPLSGLSHEAQMKITDAMFKECEKVCFLNDWQDSDEAEKEYDYAHTLGKEIFFFDTWIKEEVWDKQIM